MIEYKRFISYMYSYIGGAKQNNSGYAKIEAKSGICKLTVNIKSSNIAGTRLDVYFFYRGDENQLISIPAGTITAKGNICDCSFKTDRDNLFESNTSLDNAGGVIVISSKGDFYATEWDDIPIVPGSFTTYTAKKKRQITNNSAPKTEEVKIIENSDSQKEEPENVVDTEEVNEAVTDATLSATDTSTDTKSILPVHESSGDNISRIFDRYPGMYPFEDDEIIDCVKLEPQDIGIFPMDKWVLANNSFLLHGFYTFRHLIFARKRGTENVEYILGVPGIYRDRERFMAGMFGFNNFKSIRNVPCNTGDFGYWYMDIRL